MPDQIIQVPTDSTGKKVDCSELAVGPNMVQRQRVNLADDTAAAGVAKILNANPVGTEYGLVVRNIPSGTQGVSDGGSTLSVDDGAGSLTVDGTLTANQGNTGASPWTTQQELSPSAGGTALTVKFAIVDTATSGDNTIVSGAAGKKIRVLSVVTVVNAAVSARWKSGAATNLSGAMPLAANGGYSASACGGLFETAVGAALVLNLSAAVQTSGHLSYVEV